jgi:ABC-type multidrug transport system fused ATPase/permease subunit
MEIDKILTGFFVIEGFVEPLFSLPDFFICLFEAIVSMHRIQDFLFIKDHDGAQIEYFQDENQPYAIDISHVDFGVEKTYGNEDINDDEDEKENEKDKKNKKAKKDKRLFPKELDGMGSSGSDKEHLIMSTELKKGLINEENSYNNSIINKETRTEKIILLKDIDIQIKKGEHIGIIGEVGSGKTCLLNAFINNLQVFSEKKGNIKLSGKISFVSQSSWILNTTVEDNILFFSPKDEEKYKKVLSISQLEPDLLTLPKGDQTEIGEKGLNLSGGQKARISIARAIYSDSEIYIFDDPLSALDAYVGMNLFKQVFNDFLKDKTFIISTHALQYLSFFDRILYMKDGKIFWSGTYDEIIKEDFFEEFVKSIEKKKSGDVEEKEEQVNNNMDEENDTMDEDESSKSNILEIEKKQQPEKENKDKITFGTILTLIKFSGGYSLLFKIILVNVLWKISEVYSDYYLSSWGMIENITKKENNFRLFIYILITFPSIITIIMRQKYMMDAYINYNIGMHDLLVDKLIGAPVNLFHDITPRGHIISRLSKDLNNGATVNTILSASLRVFFQVCGAIFVCAVFNVWTIPVIILILVIEVMFSVYSLLPIQ